MNLRHALAAASVVALGVVASGPAFATSELKLTQGTNSVTLLSTAGSPSCAGTCATSSFFISNGLINWNGTLGGTTINISTGTTKPITIAPTLMDLNSININSGGATDIKIEWGDQGWNSPTGFTMKGGGTLTAGAGSTVTFGAYKDAANGLLAETSLINTLGPFGAGSFSGSANGLVAGSTVAYSLTEVLNLHFTSAGSTSGDYELDAVPEPASIVLLGGILLAIVPVVRRKRAHRQIS